LIRIQEQMQTTIIFITHDLQEALKIGDRIAIMRNGSFVQVGTPEEIVTAPANDYVLEFTRDVDRSRVLTFRSIMDEPQIVSAETPVSDLRSLFQSKPKLTGVFVKNGSGQPEGVVRRSTLGNAPDGQTASQLMSRDFLKMRANKYLHNAFEEIRNSTMIAVTNRSGDMVGAVDPITVFAHLQGPLKVDEPPTRGGAPENAEA
jgi:glycine betaine/proline transport system ATP-binding protein